MARTENLLILTADTLRTTRHGASRPLACTPGRTRLCRHARRVRRSERQTLVRGRLQNCLPVRLLRGCKLPAPCFSADCDKCTEHIVMPGPVGLAGELFDDGTRLYDASFDGREQHQTHSQAHDEANASKAGRPPAPPTPHPTSGRSRGGRAGRHNPKWRNWKPLTNR